MVYKFHIQLLLSKKGNRHKVIGGILIIKTILLHCNCEFLLLLWFYSFSNLKYIDLPDNSFALCNCEFLLSLWFCSFYNL